MSHYSKVFNKVPLQVKNKSGFDCSHENIFTGKVGTLIPTLCDPLLPGDTVSLGAMINVNLPPMATDFYGRVDIRQEAFFVPYRQIWAGFQKWISHLNNMPYNGGTSGSQGTVSGGDLFISKYLPNATTTLGMVDRGSLSDYLGFKAQPGVSTDPVTLPNIMPHIAYHWVWEHFYRDARLMKPAFAEFTIPGTSSAPINCVPYVVRAASTSASNNFTGADLNCYDGVSVLSLRQRCFSKDYFTNASLMPQQGDPATLQFAVSNNTGSFSIPALRAANSLQQWLERNQISGASNATYGGNESYYNMIIGQYGVKPSDYAMNRPIYLGGTTTNVYNKSVYTTNGYDTSVGAVSNNPFAGGVASKFASSQAVGEGSLVDKFTASEHGFLMVITSLVPHQNYGTGIRRYLMENTVDRIPFPVLAGMGDQAIYKYELSGSTTDTSVFGYTDLYSHYKWMDDEVHGLLSAGQSLASFALQSAYNVNPVLGSSFVEIPTDYMDDVTAVSADLSTYGYWADEYFVYHKASTLPVYSIPTLEDMKDTHTIMVDKNGRRF